MLWGGVRYLSFARTATVSGVRVRALGFGVWGLGFGLGGLGFAIWGVGFGVWRLGLGVWGLRFGEFELWILGVVGASKPERRA